MYGLWLAGVIAAACWADACDMPTVRAGMTREQVNRLLGQPRDTQSFASFGRVGEAGENFDISWYVRAGCLGGRHECHVKFNERGRVSGVFCASYTPLSAIPPGLQPLRDYFAPEH
jgi:hypothetical protein